MINLEEYGPKVLICKSDYNEDDRIYLNSLQKIGDKNRFELIETSEGLYIKPYNFIGSIQLSKHRINIFPRFDHNFRRLIPMILFTKDIKFGHFKKDIQTHSSEQDLFEIIIQLFLEEVKVLFNRNFAKNYIKKNENIKVMKGRIDFTSQITKNYLRSDKIFCNYEELDTDIIENKVILEALNVCLKKTNNDKTKRNIRIIKSMMESYCTPYKKSVFPKIKYNRLNHYYKEVHYYCKIIIENIGIDNLYEQGRFVGKYSILSDMNKLFEEFVSCLCKKYLSNKYKVYSQYKVNRSIVDNNDKYYSSIIPDILLVNDNEYVIMDTKNKDYGHKKVSNNDIYQLNFYGRYFSDMYELNKNIKIKIIYPLYKQGEINENYKDTIIIKTLNRKQTEISLVGIDLNKCIDYISS